MAFIPLCYTSVPQTVREWAAWMDCYPIGPNPALLIGLSTLFPASVRATLRCIAHTMMLCIPSLASARPVQLLGAGWVLRAQVRNTFPLLSGSLYQKYIESPGARAGRDLSAGTSRPTLSFSR